MVKVLNKGDTITCSPMDMLIRPEGPEGEKFMYSQFRELLAEISINDMEKQEEILEETLNNWRGEIDQLDDILVMGFKV